MITPELKPYTKTNLDTVSTPKSTWSLPSTDQPPPSTKKTNIGELNEGVGEGPDIYAPRRAVGPSLGVGGAESLRISAKAALTLSGARTPAHL